MHAVYQSDVDFWIWDRDRPKQHHIKTFWRYFRDRRLGGVLSLNLRKFFDLQEDLAGFFKSCVTTTLYVQHLRIAHLRKFWNDKIPIGIICLNHLIFRRFHQRAKRLVKKFTKPGSVGYRANRVIVLDFLADQQRRIDWERKECCLES